MSSPLTPGSLRIVKLLAVSAVIAVLLVAWRLGVLARLADPVSAARALRELGAWGYVAFIVAYTVFQPFGVPGTVFVVAAPLIWPWPIAFALSMAGTMAASVVGFSFARLLARDWLAQRLPAWLRKYDDALAARAFLTVFVLRLVFWMPQVLHTFFGVSRVRFWTHFWASFAGYLLPLFLISYFGQKLFDALQGAPPRVWIARGVGVALAILVWWLLRRRRLRQMTSIK